MFVPRAPALYQKRLRDTLNCRSLTIEFDEDTAEEIGSEAWSVWYTEKGHPVWVYDWPHPLDGNIEALIVGIQRIDYSRMRPKDHLRLIDEKMERIKAQRKRRRLDEWKQRASYLRRAFDAWADGRPSVTAAHQVPAQVI